jgi:hypothetical protein
MLLRLQEPVVVLLGLYPKAQHQQNALSGLSAIPSLFFVVVIFALT